MFDNSSSSSSSSTEKKSTPFNAVKEAANAVAKKKLPTNPDLEEIEHLFSQPVKKDDSSKPVRKSRYIQRLVETAHRRKADAQRVLERRLVNEREKEDILFEGKEKFVTPAYKRKLEENEQLRKAEQLEEMNQPSAGDVSQFYSKLLRKAHQSNNTHGSKISPSGIAASKDTDDETKKMQAEPQTSALDSLQPRHKPDEFGNTNEPVNNQIPPPSTDGGVHVSTKDAEDKSNTTVTKEKSDKLLTQNQKRGLRRNNQQSIEAYRKRYFGRRAKRLAASL